MRVAMSDGVIMDAHSRCGSNYNLYFWNVWWCVFMHVCCNWHWKLFYSSLLGFPNEPAADIALNTVKCWIEQNPNEVGRARPRHIKNKAVNLKPFVQAVSFSCFCWFAVCGDCWTSTATQNNNSNVFLYRTDILTTLPTWSTI